jgi:NADPH:quinone reductase-like Zn-dependent oxidoreductase
MKAAGIGPWDVKAMIGMFGELPMPFVPGFEFAGVVEAVGDGMTGPAVGDSVYGTDWKAGSLAELRVVPAGTYAATPSSLDFTQAAAVPVGASTALEGIEERLQLRAGETILITGASGGVGTFAVQLAHHTGARVIGLAGGANHEYVRRLGADEVVDYRDGDWVAQVRGAATGGVDALFDAVGGQTVEGAVEALRDGGRAVYIAGAPPKEPGRGISAQFFSAGSGTARMERLAAMIDGGRLRVGEVETYGFDDARQALEKVAEGHTRGKIVVTF